MKRPHFEQYAPVCPVCLGRAGAPESPLTLAEVVSEAGDDVLEGRLLCSEPACQVEYPILEGIPYLAATPASFLATNAAGLLERRDVPESLASLIGDACGPGSAYDATRQHLSSYAWDHYGDLDPEESDWSPEGSIASLLAAALTAAGEPRAAKTLDIGCGPARTSFALAERDPDALVLGVDLHVPMLRLAGEVVRAGRVRYPRRKVGLVYRSRVFEAALPRERVDVWACDATRLPFRAGSVGLATAMNLLDCVGEPLAFLNELARVLEPGAKAALASPYDWSPGATPLGQWLGGHSQRDERIGGDSAAVVRSLLGGEHAAGPSGLSLTAEGEAPWRVRMHERSTMHYRAHVVAVERR